jgi:hypothetical protein
VPRIDDGPTDGPPGRRLKSAWVTLSLDEARELLEALVVWDEQVSEGLHDPGWHTHIVDAAGNELTIAVEQEREGGEPRPQTACRPG